MNTRIHVSQEDVIACAYLFSPEDARTRGFVENLGIDEVKKAFRKKVKRYHPDLHRAESGDMTARRQERFVKIRHAYEHLFHMLEKRDPGVRKEKAGPGHPCIIGIGGAKGGIGKSILASNLSVYLAGKGYDTVAADLDLGGANLHLFLGRPHIRQSINHYLNRKVEGVEDILLPTRYGPRLMGGDSSQLGAANISFTQKLKLLNAIRRLRADYVVMDLGGDTAYNVIDFFLAADLQIVMTTCDPASYLDAYSFIKVALYRKLNRLHGPESMTACKTTPVLKQLIRETTMSKNNPRVGDIEALMARVKKEHPRSMAVIQKAIGEFRPQIIVNKAESDAEAEGPVKRIREVSRKKLCVNLGYLCAMPFQKGIEKSARTLVPWILTGADPRLVRKIENIARLAERSRPIDH